MERLKHELYARDHESVNSDIRAPLSTEDADVPVAWHKEKEPERPIISAPITNTRRMSAAAKFLMGSLAFFVIAASVAAFIFFGGGNIISSQNIELEIVAPTLIDGGKSATFQIIIRNHNQAELQLADLVIDYPQGTRDSTDETKALTHDRISIGTIAPGGQEKRTVTAVFYGKEGEQQILKAGLQYSIAGSNATLEKDSSASFTLGSSPVSVNVTAPGEATAGEQFTISVEVQNNAPSQTNSVMLLGQYPFGFSVINTTPQAEAGGTVWRLGAMQPGESKTIKLTGTLTGVEGDERVFKFTAGSQPDQTDPHIKVPFVIIPTSVTVHKPFITTSISVNGQSGKSVSAPAGKALQGIISWQNNLDSAITDGQLVLTINGPSLDKASVGASNGFYQSANNTITWSSQQEPGLANIPPGGSGSVQFSFGTVAPGTGGVVYTNPTIDLSLSVKGTRLGSDNSSNSVTSASSLQVQVSSAASLTAEAHHFTGPFSNSGVMPPKAESNTNYAIVWTVKNSSNTIANATVSTVLPPYVQYVTGRAGDNVSYDPSSRKVTWSLGDVKAGVGYSTTARTGAFQVTLTPSTSQVGTAPALTGTAVLSGQDRFAQTNISTDAAAPTTNVSGEPGFTTGMDLVAPK